ncbi:MAG: DUF2070 family protein [Candidatus Thorarchaeota archaeon]
MGEQAKVRETVDLYQKVWQLPTYRRIVLQMIFAIVLGSLSLSVFKSLSLIVADIFEPLAFYIITYSIPTFLGTGLLYVIVRKKDSPLDARRTAGAVQFGIYFWIGFSVIGGLLDFLLSASFYEIRLGMLGLSGAYCLFSFLVTGLSDHHAIRNFMGAVSIPILWYLLVFILGPFSISLPNLPLMWPVYAIVTLVVFALAVNYIFRSVSMPFERDLGINGPELLRAFGYDYLTENPKPFEDLMTQIADVQDVPLEVMIFKSREKLVAVGVVLYVHPGPFRDIGSSGLTYAIMQHIEEKYGASSFIMHGACTHHQNLTNKEDYDKVFLEVDRLIEGTQTYEQMSGPHWSEIGKFKIWSIFAGRDALTISTSAPEFTDDISLAVGRETANLVRSKTPNIESIAIVDAHNCIDDNAVSVMPGGEEAAKYVDAVSSAVLSTLDKPHRNVSVGIARVNPNISSKEGIGPGGVVVLALNDEKQNIALVTIDANNVVPGFRENIIEHLKNKGFDDAEVLTTDTHVVNAISLSSKGYSPVGQNKPEETLVAITEAAVGAKDSLQPVQVGIGFSRVAGLRTFGEMGFDTLTNDVTEAYGIAKRVGLSAGGGSFLLSLLLALLL